MLHVHVNALEIINQNIRYERTHTIILTFIELCAKSYNYYCASVQITIFSSLDVDECNFINGGCQDTCINTKGSFLCSCEGNRTLESDGKSCKGKVS